MLTVVELPEPQAGPGEVRIRVHAAAVNPTDVMLRTGGHAVRLRDRPPPYVPGMDAAGVIDQLGQGVDDRLSVGQRVVAMVLFTSRHGGAYAEWVVVPAASVVPAPAGVDLPAASTLLMNALTARLALDQLAVPPGGTPASGLRPGTAAKGPFAASSAVKEPFAALGTGTVAVTGAAGAVGGYAVELAKADGLTVIADAAPGDVDRVRGFGADHVVARGAEVAARIRELAPEGVPGLVDGSLQTTETVPAIADGGALAQLRGWSGPAERGIRVYPVMVADAMTDTDRLDLLRRQVEDGTLSLHVADVLPAEEAARAHRLLAAGGLRGRLVLDFS
ncbi:NADP-dependent oxidoreductase [Actinophytocola sediminis]